MCDILKSSLTGLVDNFYATFQECDTDCNQPGGGMHKGPPSVSCYIKATWTILNQCYWPPFIEQIIDKWYLISVKLR